MYLLLAFFITQNKKETSGSFLSITILFTIDNILYCEIVPIFWFAFILVKLNSLGNICRIKLEGKRCG